MTASLDYLVSLYGYSSIAFKLLTRWRSVYEFG